MIAASITHPQPLARSCPASTSEAGPYVANSQHVQARHARSLDTLWAQRDGGESRRELRDPEKLQWHRSLSRVIFLVNVSADRSGFRSGFETLDLACKRRIYIIPYSFIESYCWRR